MIDVNKLLTTVLAGGPVTDQGSARLPSRPIAGRSDLGEFVANNAGALRTGALAGGLAGMLLTS